MTYLDLLHKKYNKVTLTAIEAANELGISKRTLERMIKNNEFQVKSIDRGHRKLYLLKSFAMHLEAFEIMVAS